MQPECDSASDDDKVGVFFLFLSCLHCYVVFHCLCGFLPGGFCQLWIKIVMAMKRKREKEVMRFGLFQIQDHVHSELWAMLQMSMVIHQSLLLLPVVVEEDNKTPVSCLMAVLTDDSFLTL